MDDEEKTKRAREIGRLLRALGIVVNQEQAVKLIETRSRKPFADLDVHPMLIDAAEAALASARG